MADISHLNIALLLYIIHFTAQSLVDSPPTHSIARSAAHFLHALQSQSLSVAAAVAVAVAVAAAAFDFKLQYIMCGLKAFAVCRRHVVSLLCFCCCFLTSCCCCCRCCCDGCCCCFLAINWYFSCPRRCQLCYFLAMKVIPNAWHSDSSQAKLSWAERRRCACVVRASGAAAR